MPVWMRSSFARGARVLVVALVTLPIAGCGLITAATVIPIVESAGGGGGSANQAPSVQAVQVTSDPIQPGAAHGATITLSFVLVDPEGDAADVGVFVEPEDGTLDDPERAANLLVPADAFGRFPASAAADSPSLLGLAASAAGTTHTFRWRSAVDVVNLANVQLRLVATGSGGTSVGALTEQIDVVNDQPRLADDAFPAAEVGIPYVGGPVVEGGIAPYTLIVPESQRPAGLAVLGDQLTGTPTRAGFFALDYAVVDSTGLRVTPAAPHQLAIAERLALASSFVPLGAPGETNYSYTFPSRGGQGALTFTLEPAAALSDRAVDGLPAGLALSADGVLSGACPTEAAIREDHGGVDDFQFRVRVTDELLAESASDFVLRVRQTFEASRSIPLPVTRYTALAIGDWDGDGDGDLIVAPTPVPPGQGDLPGHNLVLVENRFAEGAGAVAHPRLVGNDSFVDARRVLDLARLGDVSGDGVDDALIRYEDEQILIVTGQALVARATQPVNPGFGTLAAGSLKGPRDGIAGTVADLDGPGGNGRPEVVLFARTGKAESLESYVATLGSGGLDDTGVVTSTADLSGLGEPSIGVDARTFGGAVAFLRGPAPGTLTFALAFTGKVVFVTPDVDDVDRTDITAWQVVQVLPIDLVVGQPGASGPEFVSRPFTPYGVVRVGSGLNPRLVLTGAAEGLVLPPRVEGALVLALDAGAYTIASRMRSTGVGEVVASGGPAAVADLDADGHLDLVIPLPGERSAAFVFGPLASLPQELDLGRALRAPIPAQAEVLLAGDHDGSGGGRLDLLAASRAEPFSTFRHPFTLVRNIGLEGGFLPQRLNAPTVFLLGDPLRVGEGVIPPGIAVDDFDGDGQPDVLVHRNELLGAGGEPERRNETIGGGVPLSFRATTVLLRHEEPPAPETGAAGPPDESLDTAVQEELASDEPLSLQRLGGSKSATGAFAGLARMGFASGDVNGLGDGRAEVVLAIVDPDAQGFAIAVRGFSDAPGEDQGLAELARIATGNRLAIALALADLAPADDSTASAPHRIDILAVTAGAGGVLQIEAFVQRAPEPGGSGQLVFEATAPVAIPDDAEDVRDMLVADLTGDGLVDICLTVNDALAGPSLLVFPGIGEPAAGTAASTAAFGQPLRFNLPTAGTLAEIVAADLADATGDGLLDAVLLVADTVLGADGTPFRVSTVHVIENNGAGALEDRGRKIVLPAVHDRALVARDLDGDGILDLAVMGSGENARLSVLLGTGDGGYALRDTLIVGRLAATMRAADVDRDGVPDFVVFTEAYDELLGISSDGKGGLVRWTR